MVIQRDAERASARKWGSHSEAEMGREARADRRQELETGGATESLTPRDRQTDRDTPEERDRETQELDRYRRGGTAAEATQRDGEMHGQTRRLQKGEREERAEAGVAGSGGRGAGAAEQARAPGAGS